MRSPTAIALLVVMAGLQGACRRAERCHGERPALSSVSRAAPATESKYTIIYPLPVDGRTSPSTPLAGAARHRAMERLRALSRELLEIDTGVDRFP